MAAADVLTLFSGSHLPGMVPDLVFSYHILTPVTQVDFKQAGHIVDDVSFSYRRGLAQD
jgi:hypothetical protein